MVLHGTGTYSHLPECIGVASGPYDIKYCIWTVLILKNGRFLSLSVTRRSFCVCKATDLATQNPNAQAYHKKHEHTREKSIEFANQWTCKLYEDREVLAFLQ